MAAQPKAIREAKLKAEAGKAKRKRPIKGSTRKPALAEAHRSVVDEYFKNGCVSMRRALIAAGYAQNTAVHTPHMIFGRDDVKAEIERRHAAHEKKAQVTEERIIAEMAKLAFTNMGDLLEVNEDGTAYMDFNKLTPDMKAAVAEFQVEQYEEKQASGEEDGSFVSVPVKKSRVKFASKQAALDSLARIKGMYRDKVEVSHVGSLVERIQAARKRVADGKPKP